MAESRMRGCRPWEKVRFRQEVFCVAKRRLRMDDGDDALVLSSKKLANFFEMAHCHLTDEKKLTFAFVGRSLGQELLHAEANFAPRWLPLFEFIYHHGFKTARAPLQQFADPAPIGQGKRCQGCGK